MSRKKTYIINSVSGAVQIILTAALTFITIPLFIKLLGNAAYGIFAIISVVGNLNIFANIGLNTALTKNLSEQGKCQESDYDVFVSLSINFLISFPLILVSILFNKYILTDLLKIPPLYFEDAKILFIFLLVANFVILIGQTLTSVLDSMHKIYLTNLFQLIYNICYWGLIIIFLLLGFALKMIGLAILAASIIWIICIIYSTLKFWGRLKINGIRKNYLRVTKKQLSYGSKIYTAGLINFCLEPLTKILISRFLGVNQVGYYDIALKIRNQIWNLISKIVYPLFPMIAQSNDKKVVKNLISSFQHKLILLVIPVIVIVIFCTKPFITLWLPLSDINVISQAVIYITSFYMLGIIALPTYYYLLAKDMASKTIILQCSNVFFNAIFIIAGYKFFGFFAVILGSIAAIFSSLIISLFLQKKYLNLSLFNSFGEFVKLLLIFGGLVVINTLCVFYFQTHWIILIIIPIITMSLALFLYITLKIYNPFLKIDYLKAKVI